jgi:hypothetical protein
VETAGAISILVAVIAAATSVATTLITGRVAVRTIRKQLAVTQQQLSIIHQYEVVRLVLENQPLRSEIESFFSAVREDEPNFAAVTRRWKESLAVEVLLLANPDLETDLRDAVASQDVGKLRRCAAWLLIPRDPGALPWRNL